MTTNHAWKLGRDAPILKIVDFVTESANLLWCSIHVDTTLFDVPIQWKSWPRPSLFLIKSSTPARRKRKKPFSLRFYSGSAIEVKSLIDGSLASLTSLPPRSVQERTLLAGSQVSEASEPMIRAWRDFAWWSALPPNRQTPNVTPPPKFTPTLKNTTRTTTEKTIMVGSYQWHHSIFPFNESVFEGSE